MRASRALVILCLLAGSLPAVLRSSTGLAPIRELADGGRTYEALRQLEPILAEQPEDPEVLLLKGVLLAELDRQDEARQIFFELTQSHPELPEPYNNLAALYGAQGDYEQAVEVLKQALRTHPSYRTAFDNLTRVYGRLAARAYGEALGRGKRNESEGVGLTLLAEIGPGPAASGDRIAAVSVRPEAPKSGTLAAGAESGAEAAEPAPPGALPGLDEAKEMVNAWAAAWSAQRAEDYLSFYGGAFVPPDGLDRVAWEKQRRERLSRPSFIQVELAPLDAERTAAGGARVRFRQTYESDRFSDRVTKVLELALEGGSWKIVDERVEEQIQ